MPGLAPGQTIETVRDRIGTDLAERAVAFWSEQGRIEPDEARRRLSEIVAVIRDRSGDVAGLSAITRRELAPVAGLPFWRYESVLAPGAADAEDALFNASFEAVEAGFDSSVPGPVGLCVLVDDPAERERRPEAVWPETELMYAGYDGSSQIRIRYLHDAIIGPGLPSSPSIAETETHDYELESRYRIEPLADSDAVGPDEVLEFWAREGAVPAAEAERRVHEVLLIGRDRDGSLAGVSTVYLRRNPQLRMDLWHFRTFIGPAHRNGKIAVQLLWRSRDRLEELFVTGEDTRGAGVVIELEHEGLKKYFNRGFWIYSNVVFIGENERGDHVRAYYFPGAKAPGPG